MNAKQLSNFIFDEVKEWAIEHEFKRMRKTSGFISRVEVYEFDKSYEKFSVTDSPNHGIIFNFDIIDLEDGKMLIKKLDPKSTKHVVVNANAKLEYDVVIRNHKAILRLFFMDRVEYADGTHRYEK